MTAADTIAAAITALQQEIATQEASNPLYAQRDSLQTQLASTLQQITVLEAASPEIRTARATLAKLLNLQSAGALPSAAAVQVQGV